MPGLDRSASPVMFFGLPAATAISSLFVAKVTGGSTRPASTSFCMFFVSAEANTSAWAPCCIWATRAVEPAKLYVIARLGWAVVSVALAALNAPVSDAAANTLTDPVSGAAVVVVVAAAAGLVLDEQAPSSGAIAAVARSAIRRTLKVDTRPDRSSQLPHSATFRAADRR